MGRKTQNRPPGTDPVTPVELKEDHVKPRLILVIVLILAALAAFGYVLHGLLPNRTGWQEIRSSRMSGDSVSGELNFYYYLEKKTAAADYRQATLIYTDAAEQAGKIFSASQTYEGLGNLASVNQHPGESVTVDEALYRALEILEQAGCRAHYLAPVYRDYDNLFQSETDEGAAQFDPLQNEEEREYVRAAAAFAADADAVNLELMEDSQVRLQLSEEYQAFAKTNGIDIFVDLYWMKNAFAMDYIAGILSESGLTNGYLSSEDGFLAVMERAEGISVPVWTREGNQIEEAEAISLDGPACLVRFRGFTLEELPYDRFREMSPGEFRTPYIDLADGICRLAADPVYLYSAEKSCGEIAAAGYGAVVTEELTEESRKLLESSGIHVK